MKSWSVATAVMVVGMICAVSCAIKEGTGKEFHKLYLKIVWGGVKKGEPCTAPEDRDDRIPTEMEPYAGKTPSEIHEHLQEAATIVSEISRRLGKFKSEQAVIKEMKKSYKKLDKQVDKCVTKEALVCSEEGKCVSCKEEATSDHEDCENALIIAGADDPQPSDETTSPSTGGGDGTDGTDGSSGNGTATGRMLLPVDGPLLAALLAALVALISFSH